MCLVAQLCPTLCNPMDCIPPGPLSTGFSRQEYWSGLPCPLPEDLPDPGIEPESFVPPALQLDSLPTEPLRKPLSERWGSQPRHKSRYKYSQVVWWYRAAFGNERAILKYLKGRLVSQNLGLLYEVPMDWTNLWETYSRSWEPKMTLHLSDQSGYNRGRVVSWPWHCQDSKY